MSQLRSVRLTLTARPAWAASSASTPRMERTSPSKVRPSPSGATGFLGRGTPDGRVAEKACWLTLHLPVSGRRYDFASGSLTEELARSRGVEVDETLDLIERGRLTVPDG